MEFVNVTPHTLNIITNTSEGMLVLPPSGDVARVTTNITVIGDIDGVQVVYSVMGELAGLPEPREGVVYIASAMAAEAAQRGDVLCPGALVRNDQGQPVGCNGLRAIVSQVGESAAAAERSV